jgi:hypothetical protein
MLPRYSGFRFDLYSFDKLLLSQNFLGMFNLFYRFRDTLDFCNNSSCRINFLRSFVSLFLCMLYASYKTMKSLSLKQPYAELLISGKKTIELRKWNTNFRGHFLVHASKNVDKEKCESLGNRLQHS